MSVRRTQAHQLLHGLDAFDAIIDARSPAEYAHDHLPGALNWPSLDDAERARVGTLHAQHSPFEARKLGAALVARNIAGHIERELGDKPRNWRPLLYCWRGGQRSSALALILGQIGFPVTVLDGGYKAFRSALLADLPAQVARLRFQVVCGPTGSGKTRLLHALTAAGAQVLDLEALACHRASVLGLIPGLPQPSQKRFETLLWQRLRSLDPKRPVFVEAESKKVGNLAVPDALMSAMRASACLRLDLPEPERVALLLEDYPFFVNDPDFFCRRLDTLRSLRGHATIDAWQALVAQDEFETVVRELLRLHYDPGYERSTRRNFSGFAQARPVALTHRANACFAQAAQELATTSIQAP